MTTEPIYPHVRQLGPNPFVDRSDRPDRPGVGRLLRRATAVLLPALVACAVAVPGAAAPGKPMLHAKPDSDRPAADDSGKRPDPYVAFALTGATAGSAYRLVVDTSPSRGKVPCNGGLGTSWTNAFAGGHVVFDLEPVTNGTYFPFAGNEPCRGRYELDLDERKRGSGQWDTIRRFAFSYPSFKVAPLPLH